MFTGLIEATAKVLERSAAQLKIERPAVFDDVKLGSSIAVAGTCLSITKLDAQSMSFDTVPTTLTKTNLGALKKRDRVNLERAMKADSRLEGHIVQGHVEGVAEVICVNAPSPSRERGERGGGTEGDATLTVRMPSRLLPFVIPQGSITLDGVSLTVASLQGSSVTVALIPETLAKTTLGDLKKGDTVNIETDILGKYVLASHDAC